MYSSSTSFEIIHLELRKHPKWVAFQQIRYFKVVIKAIVQVQNHQLHKILILITWDSSLKFKLLQFSLAVPNKEQESLKISNSWVSLKDEAIFLCLVRDRLASASDIWFISQVRCERSWTPIIQCSTEPYEHIKYYF